MATIEPRDVNPSMILALVDATEQNVEKKKLIYNIAREAIIAAETGDNKVRVHLRLENKESTDKKDIAPYSDAERNALDIKLSQLSDNFINNKKFAGVIGGSLTKLNELSCDEEAMPKKGTPRRQLVAGAIHKAAGVIKAFAIEVCKHHEGLDKELDKAGVNINREKVQTFP